MGCDIHIRVEQKNGQGSWKVVKPGKQPSPYYDDKEIEDWPTPRNYRFFALVANVRNYDDDPVEPISPPRGLPVDMASAIDADEAFEEYEEADAAGVTNLGDHSFTWLYLDELQEGLRRHGPEGIPRAYWRLVFDEWPKHRLRAVPNSVRIIMGFDS